MDDRTSATGTADRADTAANAGTTYNGDTAHSGGTAHIAGQALASVSLDLDNLWSYLKGKGDARWVERPSYFDVVVRLLAGFGTYVAFAA